MQTLGNNPDVRVAKAVRESILGHYQLVAPLMESLFAGTPLVCAAYPHGLGNYVVYRGALYSEAPGNLRTIDVVTQRGCHTYLRFSADAIEWLIQHTSAVEFHGWGCAPDNPNRARFGRILLSRDRETHSVLAEAAQKLREMLGGTSLAAIPLLQGSRAMAMWIPFTDPVPYEDLRRWLHAFCAVAGQRYPALFSLEPNTIASGRVHLHVTSNAPGRYSALPYSLRGDPELRVCAPLTWDEVAHVKDGDIDTATFPARLARLGDLFGQQLTAIGNQAFPDKQPLAQATPGSPKHGVPIEPHGRVLQAAATVLQDGKPRDAKQVLSEAVARGLLPAQTPEKYVYTALLEYIVRASGHGHKPFVMQSADRRFRLNEPLDEWPSLDLITISPDAATLAVIQRLSETGSGKDPTAFELAVCDAFSHLGFVTTHVGGQNNPDGYADAPLGVRGYRTMLECKTGATVVNDPDAVEASKFREAFGADLCAIVGTRYTEELDLMSELQTHRVAAFSVDDLQQLLRIGSNPLEMRPLFEPGFVSDRLGDVLWERVHGACKRLTIICDYVCTAGWDAQVAFAKSSNPAGISNAPRLTADAAMLLVDQRLRDEGSAATCSRADVEAAFAYLTSPRVGWAAWADDRRDAIVVAGGKTKQN